MGPDGGVLRGVSAQRTRETRTISEVGGGYLIVKTSIVLFVGVEGRIDKWSQICAQASMLLLDHRVRRALVKRNE